MKRAIWPLTSVALSILAAVLAFELWIAKRQVDPPTANTAHAGAQIEIALGRKSLARSCDASNPQALSDMETLEGVDLRSLPQDQRELLQQVAWRLGGADAAYNALFFADNHPMVDYDDQAIVKAAEESTDSDGPAATALKEIYFEIPILYKDMQRNCVPSAPAPKAPAAVLPPSQVDKTRR